MEEINPLIASGIVWWREGEFHVDAFAYAMMSHVGLHEAETALRAIFAGLFPDTAIVIERGVKRGRRRA